MGFGSDIKPEDRRGKGKDRKMKKNILSIFLFFFVFSPFAFPPSPLVFAAENIKEPNVAGTFYPSDPKELSFVIQKYMREAQKTIVSGDPVVLISPHAGYIYSGPVAAYGYTVLSQMEFDTVIVLSATHYFDYHGASVYRDGVFRTPLGDLAIDEVLASKLIEKDPKLLFFDPKMFEREHSLETQLPFLQESLKAGFRILPVLIGEMNYDECVLLASYLANITDGKKVLVVASTDLSHYRPYEQAMIYDKKTAGFIRRGDPKGLWDDVAGTGWNVCGIRPVVVALNFAERKEAGSVEVFHYANSGDTAGDKERVVGYLSALITKEAKESMKAEDDMLTQQEKKRLLEIARATLVAHVTGKNVPGFEESLPGLNLRRGVFVTLNKGDELRGCIGVFSSQEALFKTVGQMTLESSTNDYRFSPVTAKEAGDIAIEISVLTEPKEIDDWAKVRLGTDGVIVRRGGASGVFLPQVATETKWDLETFLGQLCSQKAGLPWDCYKDSQTKIYTFQAEIFSEKEE